MTKRARQLIFACALPVLILFGLCFYPIYTLITGEEVTLKTRSVDPSEVFRGDYVALSYEAEEIPVDLLEKEVLGKGDGGTVYVLLKEKNGVDIPERVTLIKPHSGLYLQGKLSYIGPNRSGKQTAFIQYSLDRYYVEDNTGTDWEKASINGQILAKAKVKNGYAILTTITKQELK